MGKNFIYNILFKGFVIIWVLLYVFYSELNFQSQKKYYAFAMSATMLQLREYNSIYDQETQDYFAILNYIDRRIPQEEELSMVLPTDNRNKNEFLSGKGRYLIYPKYYGDTNYFRKYVLVYDVKDYKFDGYKIFKRFGENKYLLKKEDL